MFLLKVSIFSHLPALHQRCVCHRRCRRYLIVCIIWSTAHSVRIVVSNDVVAIWLGDCAAPKTRRDSLRSYERTPPTAHLGYIEGLLRLSKQWYGDAVA